MFCVEKKRYLEVLVGVGVWIGRLDWRTDGVLTAVDVHLRNRIEITVLGMPTFV